MDSSGANHQDVVPPVEGVAGGGTAYGWNDGGLEVSKPLKGSIDPSEVPTADLVHVWCMPSTANVGAQEMPRQLEFSIALRRLMALVLARFPCESTRVSVEHVQLNGLRLRGGRVENLTSQIHLLAARNERESVQVALRPKASWGSSCSAGVVQIQCTDLVSTSGDRLLVGQSVAMRKVVPILGVPDALVPLDHPVSQISLVPGETTSIWVSVDVPSTQSPGQYEGEFIITAIAESELHLQSLSKAEKQQLCMELRNCLDIVEPIEGKPYDEVVERVKSASTCLRRVLLSPSFSEFFSDNGSVDIMDEDAISHLSVQVKINLTVWDFVLPATPSLPAVFGISDTVIEDRFGVEHGTQEWYEELEKHFKWLLQYKISPYFCRWGQNMRVLTYTCPWPADHPKADEYYSDERLAAYAVPYSQAVPGYMANLPSISSHTRKDYLQKEVEILKTKSHWKKAYFYLWDEPLQLEHYESVRKMASEIHAYAPDARVLTTYYCGPSDAPLAPTSFESFLKVPKFLRPHTQIYCTSEWVLGNREDLVKDILSELQPDNGEEWWTYVCMGPSDPHPNWHLGMRGTQHRAVLWRVWKEGGTGFLYWGANCYEKASFPSAEIRFRRGLPPGDGVLFYPGEVFSASHEPVASLRLERLLSGLQDFEYLKLYASKYGRDEGHALLEKTGVYLGPERYTTEHMPIDVMRGEIYNRCQP